MAIRTVVLLAGLCLGAAFGEDSWTGVERIVFVGDLHGDYGQTVAILQSAGLIDGELNWSGGKTHLVQSGDAVDRGPAPRQVIELLMRLETQARTAGGYVHPLIGNHEAMNLAGDLKNVSAAAFEEFARDAPSKDKSHPPGYAEYRRQFGPFGKYGKWIRSHNAIVRINDTLFLHGGISPKYVDQPMRDLNAQIRLELSDPPRHAGGLASDPEGPLWYRGLANGDEKELMPHVEAALRRFEVARIAIGHTFADGAITPRFGGKVLMADVGLARLYDQFSRLACLVIEPGDIYALHRGKRVSLPSDTGADLLRYLMEAARLDPQPSALLRRIERLKQQLSPAAAP